MPNGKKPQCLSPKAAMFYTKNCGPFRLKHCGFCIKSMRVIAPPYKFENNLLLHPQVTMYQYSLVTPYFLHLHIY